MATKQRSAQALGANLDDACGRLLADLLREEAVARARAYAQQVWAAFAKERAAVRDAAPDLRFFTSVWAAGASTSPST